MVYANEEVQPKKFDLFLMRFKNDKWLLAVCGIQNIYSHCVCVFSDVPTVCFNRCAGVYADNKTIDQSDRKTIKRTFYVPFRACRALVLQKNPTSQYREKGIFQKGPKGVDMYVCFPAMVLHYEHGKICHALYHGKELKGDVSRIGRKPSNASDMRPYVFHTPFDIARLAASMENKKFHRHERDCIRSALSLTEDPSNIFTSEY